MGVRVNLAYYAPSQAAAEAAARSAFARFAELEQIMSDYRPDSEVMRLCDQAGRRPVPVSRDLFRVLERAREIAERSNGAFDVTCGPLVRLWRQSRASGSLPTPEEIAGARTRVGWQSVRLHRNRTVEIDTAGVRIDLGGIAKGYACDEALKTLRGKGVDRALVQAGGDLAASGPPPGKRGWTIALGGSGQTADVVHAAVSTSGDTEQFVEVGGVRYSHIVDPRTGLGLTNRIQATVIARNGLTSDPLATAVCVLGRDEGAALAKRYRAKLIVVQAR
jgi:thiamine biosynthesis lipoprotein